MFMNYCELYEYENELIDTNIEQVDNYCVYYHWFWSTNIATATADF